MAAIPASRAASGSSVLPQIPTALAPPNLDLPKQILRGLSGHIDPVPVSVLYRAGMVLVMLTMLVLPLVYVALVAVVGYGVYWHATENLGILEGRGGGRGKLFAYAAPLVVGGILLIFMIKPLFARRRGSHQPLALSREEEPLLFTFVDRLCEVVGAPKPRAIHVDTDVNASASFNRGIWGVLTNRLVLTIGLPLAAGLDLRQFTGVLAHEFAHFAQGSAMRMTFVVRSINMWFARLVYDRDAWDDRIAEFAAEANNGAFTVVVWLVQGAVWVTRRVLWVLMSIGNLVSSIMLRQMEFDADRYQARVVGSETFARTFERINLLGVASRAAFADLNSAWRERRLCDNLPSLIRSRESQMPAEVRTAVIKQSTEGETGWLDSHPCDAARVASARAEAAAGLFTVDAPAAALFTDFAELARRATVAFYFEQVGPEFQPQNLIATEDMVAATSKRRDDVTAMRRYFCDLVHPLRPVFPARFDFAHSAPPRPDVAAEQLLELRSNLCARSAEGLAAAKQYEAADEKLVALERLRELMTAGCKLTKVEPKELGLNRIEDGEVRAALKTAATTRDGARRVLDGILDGGMERLTLALSLEKAAVRPPAGTTPDATTADGVTGDSYDLTDSYDLAEAPAEGSDDRLLDALRVLREAAGDVESLRRHFVLLGTVLSQVQPGQNPQSLIDTCLWHSRKCSELLRSVHAILRAAAYPYSHANKQVTVAQYVTASLPPGEQVVNVHNAADSAVDAVYALYVRLMSDLAARAEKVEANLGLPKLPDPPEEDGEESKDA